MKQSVLKRILEYIRPYRLFAVGALLSAVIGISLSLYLPILIGHGVDFIVSPGEVTYSGVARICAVLAVTLSVSAFFQWILAYLTNQIAYRTVRDIRTAVFDKINRVPLKYIDSHAHGDLVNRIVNDVDFVSDGLLQGMTQLFSGIFTILGTLVFMLTINLSITFVVVLVTPLSIFAASFIAKKTHRSFRSQSAVQGEIGAFITEMISGQRVVKAFGYEERAQKQFEEMNARLYECGQKAQFHSSLSNPGTRFVNGIVYAAVGVIGALGAIRGSMTIGQISSFLAYANQYTKPFNEVTGILTQLQMAFSAAQRLFEVLDEQEEPDVAEHKLEVSDCKGNVQIKNVAFSYRPDQSLISGLNLEVQSGNRVAIVGPTGSGKTTIVNLLMRFYELDEGEISVDGIPISRLGKSNLRGLFGMVLQETWLFHGTIRDNIAFGKPDASAGEVEAAAKAAHAHSFIERLPNGYDTVVQGGGGNLSAGQKQLLCIARIMLLHPPMLLLDEATSSIDTRTEARIQDAFDKMMEGRTSFVVAHRLSTIRNADVILVMKDGHVEEQGTHQQLLQKNGFYASIYNSQFAVMKE